MLVMRRHFTILILLKNPLFWKADSSPEILLEPTGFSCCRQNQIRNKFEIVKSEGSKREVRE